MSESETPTDSICILSGTSLWHTAIISDSVPSQEKTLQWMWRFLFHSVTESFHTFYMHTHETDLGIWNLHVLHACLPENTLPWGISKRWVVISFSLSLFSRVTDIHESVTAQIICPELLNYLALNVVYNHVLLVV